MNNATKTKRLVSLDVLRGATIAAMILVNNPGSWNTVYAQLRHASWHGWTFTDLIFPFFLFIVGVAIVFAFSKKLETDTPKKELYKKIIRRTLILFGLGLFLNGFPYFELSSLRIPGVLQRIAICYLFASIIFLHASVRWQMIWAGGLLFVYWMLMVWIPVPGVGAGSFAKGANFAAYIDSLILKGHMWSVTKTWDPEGLISTIPAISTTLFGVLTGHLLRSKKSPQKMTQWLLGLGAAGTVIGLIWGIWLPVNKSLWTSSYAVLMAGLTLLCLAVCYYLIDVKEYRKAIHPFMVYGMNAITVYVLSGIVAKLSWIIKWTTAGGDEISLKSWIYENLFASWLNGYNASLAYALSFIMIMYLCMLILYKKKIFIKI